MKHWSEMLRYIGNERQIAGARHCMLTQGGSLGVRAVDVKTGGGLEYTVLPDRGMDISLASYRGVNLTYLSPQGELNPAFYSHDGNEWLRTFFAGLLTTCGPANFGPACVDEDEALGIHGRFNVTPAVQVCDSTDFDRQTIKLTGTVNNFVLFGEKISVKRTITSSMGENSICIQDRVRNCGGNSVPYMMLYHINFGYPLLDEHAIIAVNGTSAQGYDAYSQQDMENMHAFAPPDAAHKEKNYMHKFDGVSRGKAAVFNPALGFGVSVEFSTDTLPYLTQWKMEGVRDYVLALEPANAPCVSRKELRSRGLLPFLSPGESAVNELRITVIDSIDE